MNQFIKWISQQEAFVLKEISFGLLQVLASYLLILSLYRLFKKWNFRNLAFGLIAILLLQLSFINSSIKANTNQFIIFNKNRHSIIGMKHHKNLEIHHNLDSTILNKERSFINYKIGEHLDQLEFDSLRTVYQFKTSKILVIDSLGAYNVTLFKPDYILLRNSPRINLTRLLDSLKPKQIIADASNYKSYVKRWKSTCLKKKIPFHNTYEKGAFIIKN